MANILLITSSPRGSESYSNRIADTVIRDLRNNDPDALLMARDLAQDPLPHVDDDFVTATRGREGPQTTRQQAILAESDELIDALTAADIVVIAAPMINFSVSSTLKAWLVLDELDQELERRGHRFVRYADDCNIYVRSERAGQRVMESITRFITQKLKLKVNEAKSAVARPQERKFLGFSFTTGPDIKRRIAPKSLERFKRRIRDITQRVKGVSMKTTMTTFRLRARSHRRSSWHLG